MDIIKKNGSVEPFMEDKLKSAIQKSAERVCSDLSDEDFTNIISQIVKILSNKGLDKIPVKDVHNAVETALHNLRYQDISDSYKDFRNWKLEFAYIIDKIFKKDKSIRFIGDKENSNTDSALVATKRSLIYGELNRQFYKKFNLTPIERSAIKDGYFYIHDMSARRDTMNCCLFNMDYVLKNGFEMGNINYTEPKTLTTAFIVMGDVILSTAAQQYGGFTVPEVDKILGYYAEKSYNEYMEKYIKLFSELSDDEDQIMSLASKQAWKDMIRDADQGWQGIEMKLNTVGSSRGDYPFVTMTLGLGINRYEKAISKSMLKVHMKGQGKDDNKIPVLFPKIVFLYDNNLCQENKPNHDLYKLALKCSSVTMYPDWLSLTGEGYVASMYKKYKKVISPMGCRAFLSPWYERGGMNPADDNDSPVFVGRFNIGAISLNLPMILAKSREENTDFYMTLEYYMEMIRQIHIKTYNYLSEIRASTNPVAYCEGGFYNPETNGPAHLNPTDRIKPLLKSSTASFGITALNELQVLYNGKSLVEDGQFAIEVMEWINNKIQEYKKKDGILYAIYGTPAESLCGKQVEQFRKKYGIIPGVSDREYVSNSFHCHVTEDITPIQKQNLEKRFWDLFNGGKIQYVKYPIRYNIEAIDSLVQRAMDLGFYEGINLELSYCNDCGHEELDMNVCPKCGSKNLTKISRMNGYLSYSRVHGDTRLNSAKMAEIAERKSM